MGAYNWVLYVFHYLSKSILIERKIMRCTLIRWSMAQFALEHEKLPNRSCVHSANHSVYT